MQPHRLLRPVVLAAACLLSSAASAANEAAVTAVAPGIYVGPSLESADDYCRLQRLGIRTVIDMQRYRPWASGREQRAVQQRGMTYLRIPIDFRPTNDGAPHRVLCRLADPASHPVYIHCHLGRDRTGLVIALYRVLYLQWSPQSAYAAMESTQYNPLLRDLDRYFWRYALQQPAEGRHGPALQLHP